VTFPTVVWWRQDAAGDCLLELLVAGPGPAAGQVWPGTIAQPASAPGGWALVNLPALGPMPAELARQLAAFAAGDTPPTGPDGPLSMAIIDSSGEVAIERHGTSPGGLYQGCLDAALRLVERRLAERVVSAEPFASGVLLARRAGGERSVELAPAIGSGGAGAASPIVGVPLGDGPIEQVGEGPVTVSLGPAAAATLPSVTIRLPRPGSGPGLSIELAIPDLRLPPELLDRWRPSAGGDPRLRLAL